MDRADNGVSCITNFSQSSSRFAIYTASVFLEAVEKLCVELLSRILIYKLIK